MSPSYETAVKPNLFVLIVRRQRLSTSAIVLFVVSLGCADKAETAASKPPAKSSWTTVSTDDGRAEAEMPFPTSHQEQTVETRAGTFTVTVFKSAIDGVFCNLWTMAYPEGTLEGHSGEKSFLEIFAEGHERQKEGAERISYTETKEEHFPAAEFHFTYPRGTTGNGRQHGSGFAKWKCRVMGDTVYAASVDVLDEFYAANSDEADTVVDRFLKSFVASDD